MVLHLLDDGEGDVSKDASLIWLGLDSLGATELSCSRGLWWRA